MNTTTPDMTQERGSIVNLHLPEDKRDLTTEEAAQELGVEPRTVTAHVQRGVIAAKKIAGTYFIERVELERYKAQRRKVGRPLKVRVPESPKEGTEND